jgi:hypothetical protein
VTRAALLAPLALVTALVDCGGARAEVGVSGPGPLLAATVPAATPQGAPEPPGPPRHARLSYELNGRPFPLPVVHGSIAGVPAWMLVDTGANSHVIASWVARKARLPMRALGDVGSDHTGRRVSAYSVERPGVVLDEWGRLGDGPMLVTDVPEAIERLGIGAFVSPQWLAEPGGALVLDLAAGEMHGASWTDASQGLDARAGQEIAERGPRLCRHDQSIIRGLAFVLRASIEGRGVDLLLDTGALQTDLLTTSPAGKALAARATPSHEPMYAASGLVHASVVRAAEIQIGGWALTSDVDLVPGEADPLCPRDGVISMDALRSCTLVLGRQSLRGRCGP